MASPSSRSASFVNPAAAEEGGSHMSRTSDAASELGRRLTLAGNDMPVRTRNQARDEERQQASRGARQTSGQGSRQGKATAGPSRSSRPSASGGKGASKRASGKGPAEDESDSDDSDEDDDDDDDDGEQTRSKIVEACAIYEPHGLVYDELIQPRQPGPRREASIAFRDTVLLFGRLAVNDPRIERQILKTIPLEGPLWSQETARKLRIRIRTIFEDLENNVTDVINTVKEIRNFFDAVEHIFRNYKNLDATCYGELAGLLRWTFGQIIISDKDRQEHVAYAGGQGEYNLYSRFASNRDWQHCLDTIQRIAARGYLKYFVAEKREWIGIYQDLGRKYPTRAFPNQNIADFGLVFRRYLQGWKILDQ